MITNVLALTLLLLVPRVAAAPPGAAAQGVGSADSVILAERFGARCDGTTDDTEPLQRALEATPDGGVLKLTGRAPCIVSRPLTKSRWYNARIVGVSESTASQSSAVTAVRYMGPAIPSRGVLELTGVAGLTIEGVRFDAAGRAGYGVMFDVEAGSRSTNDANARVTTCIIVLAQRPDAGCARSRRAPLRAEATRPARPPRPAPKSPAARPQSARRPSSRHRSRR